MTDGELTKLASDMINTASAQGCDAVVILREPGAEGERAVLLVGTHKARGKYVSQLFEDLSTVKCPPDDGKPCGDGGDWAVRLVHLAMGWLDGVTEFWARMRNED